MAYSKATFTGDGSTKEFNPFFALGVSPGTVTCTVNGVSTSFSVNGAGQYVLTYAPAAGAVIVFSRTVSKSSLNVNWTDGASITKTNLNTMQLQSLMLAQEALDAANEGVAGDLDLAARLKVLEGLFENTPPLVGVVTESNLSDALRNKLAALGAFAGAPAGYETALPVVQQAAGVVEGIFQNMLQEYPTYSGDLAPNYAMRTVEWRRPVGSSVNSPPSRIVSPDRPYSASSMGHVLRFFARAAQVWPDKKTTIYPIIQKLARFVRALQVENPRLARYGGFQSAAENGQCSVYNTAQCGLAMLEVYRLTDDANYLNSAKLAGEFIKRLRPSQVNAFYLANYGVTPVPQIERNGFNTFGVWLTAVDSDDTLRRQITLWDALALKFFRELAVATGDGTWETIQQGAQQFFAKGLQAGFEVFSIYDSAARAKCNDSWYLDNNIDGTTARDHQWHRRGEVVLATPLGGGMPTPVNTMGTDQIEYSIEGLYEAGYDPSLLDQYYLQYRNAITVKGGATQSSTVATYNGLFYNPGVCFSGYVRWDTALYLNSTDPNMPAGTTVRRNVQYGDHYDIQGVGPLLKFKYERHPADFAASIQAALLAGGTMSTFLNADLSSRWSTTEDFEFLTYGIGNVIGTIGLGLVEVIASLGE